MNTTFRNVYARLVIIRCPLPVCFISYTLQTNTDLKMSQLSWNCNGAFPLGYSRYVCNSDNELLASREEQVRGNSYNSNTALDYYLASESISVYYIML